jgi:Ca-activated chloride channel family protein
MHFARSEYLNFLWLVPVLGVFFLLSFRSRRRRLERLISPVLVPQLTREFSRAKAAMRAFLLLGFFIFSIIALARPQWGTRVENVRRRGVDIIVALDTSYSMNTEDVAPTRLGKAKSEIRSLIRQLKGDRIGLVSFAGTALVQCPLTLDYGAAALFIDVANTETIPEPGTSLAAAIDVANSAFLSKERKYKILILVTDGEDLEGQVDQACEKARDAGIIIYTLGIGTPEGRPIPVRDARGDVVEYHKDSGGQVVISSLDERALARVATATGGRYFRATTTEGELDELYGEISQFEKKDLESRLFQNYEDQFQYPLALALLFLAADLWISERRREGHVWLSRFHPPRFRSAGRQTVPE